MGAHRGRDPVAAVEALEPCEGERHALEWEGERDDAAAVHGGLEVVLGDVGGERDLGLHRPLDGMVGEPVGA